LKKEDQLIQEAVKNRSLYVKIVR